MQTPPKQLSSKCGLVKLKCLTPSKVGLFPFILLFYLISRIAFLVITPENTFMGRPEAWEKLWFGIDWATPDRTFGLGLSFGPLHTFIIAAFHYVFNNMQTTLMFSRVASLLSGMLLLVCFYGTAKTAFKNSQALWSAFFLSVLPVEYLFATTTLAENLAYSFLFAAFYFFAKILKNPASGWYDDILFCLCTTASCALRFESWFFMPLFALYAIYRKIPLRRIVFQGVLLSIFPLSWMYYCYRITGDPVYFATISSTISGFWIKDKSTGTMLSAFASNLVFTMGGPVLLFSLLGFFRQSANKNRKNFLWVFTLCFALLLLYKTINHTHDTTQARYLYLLSLLLCLFSGPGLELLIYFSTPARHTTKVVTIIIASCLFFNVFHLHEYRIKTKLKRIDNIKQTCADLNQLNSKTPNSTVLLETGAFTPYIQCNLNSPPPTILMYFGFPKRHETSPKELAQYLDQCTYIVLQHTFLLYKALKQIPEFEYRFKSIRKHGRWHIYAKAQ